MAHRYCVILTSIAIITFVSTVYNLQPPFFPMEAARKNLKQSEYSFVFTSFDLSAIFFGVMTGVVISKLGPRCVMLSGIFCIASACMVLGFLHYVVDSTAFLALAILTRMMEALGHMSSKIAVACILQIMFPNLGGAVTGWTEIGFGCGQLAGPLLGGVFLDLGGYPLPFIVIGTFGFLTLIPAWAYLKVDEYQVQNEDGEDLKKTLQILKVPGVWIGILANATSVSCTTGFFSSTLEPHLQQFQMSATFVGLVFLGNGCGYVASNRIWGYLCRKRYSYRLQMIIGSCLVLFGLMLIGPAPWFPLQPRLSFVITGLIMTGFGLGGNFIPSLPQMVKSCTDRCIPYNDHTKGVVTGLWLSAFNIGGVVGPSLGGVASNYMGFRNATGIVMTMELILIITVTATYVHERWQDRRASRLAGEQVPLINYDPESHLESNLSSS